MIGLVPDPAAPGEHDDPESAAHSRGERRRDIRTYRRLCREIDRLLAAGRLTEAQRLNDQARTLFRRLYGS